MCRRNQLFGCTMMALGLGILIGIWLEKTTVCALMGFGVLVLGFWCLGKK